MVCCLLITTRDLAEALCRIEFLQTIQVSSTSHPSLRSSHLLHHITSQTANKNQNKLSTHHLKPSVAQIHPPSQVHQSQLNSASQRCKRLVKTCDSFLSQPGFESRFSDPTGLFCSGQPGSSTHLHPSSRPGGLGSVLGQHLYFVVSFA